VPDVRELLESLLRETRASRITLRRDVDGDATFPIVEEALASGVASLRAESSVDLRAQPVVREILAGRQVVQHDSAMAYDDAAFQAMLAAYGGLAAQVVTPVLVDGRLAAILSVHQLGTARHWSNHEIAAATDTAVRIGELL
jgi:GAF domain-containing protein